MRMCHFRRGKCPQSLSDLEEPITPFLYSPLQRQTGLLPPQYKSHTCTVLLPLSLPFQGKFISLGIHLSELSSFLIRQGLYAYPSLFLPTLPYMLTYQPTSLWTGSSRSCLATSENCGTVLESYANTA